MKQIAVFMCSCIFIVMISVVSFAGTTNQGSWKKDNKGWRWQFSDGQYATSNWWWIDDNDDGVYESYYFDKDGYVLTNTTTPDGYTVNSDGAWSVNGVVQHDYPSLGIDKSRATSYPTDVGQMIGKSENQVKSILSSYGIQYNQVDGGCEYWDSSGASHLYMFINGICASDTLSISGNYETMRSLFEYYVNDSSELTLVESKNTIDEMRYRYTYKNVIDRDLWLRNLGNGQYSFHHTWWLLVGY